MKKNKKTIIWLCIFIFLIIVFSIVGTYGILNIRKINIGTFDVDVYSKGVNIFTLPSGADVSKEANVYNFRKDYGHDIVAETFINPTLDTTNSESSVCYEISVQMPDKQVFEYSRENTEKKAELVLDILYSNDGSNYDYVIEKKDITTLTGLFKVPTPKNSEEYKNIIHTTRRVKRTDYWKLKVTFVYMPDVDQQVNDEKSYNISLNANVVDC